MVNNLSSLIEGSILIHLKAQHFTDILFWKELKCENLHKGHEKHSEYAYFNDFWWIVLNDSTPPYF